MKYMVLMYADESIVSKFTLEQLQAAVPAWQALAQEAQAAGVLLSSSGFAPVANATTIRIRNGKTLITDGPFAETHEQLGGGWLFDCQDLDEAIRWAAKIPTAKYGAIEIRPLWGQN
jgi:hypothetical protein